MNIRQFVRNNRDDWNELEQLISIINKRTKNKLTSKHIERFNQLYQKVAQHLSYCQTYFPNEDVTLYLNEIVAKSHNLLYKDQVTSWQQIRHFFSTTFIQLFLEQWKFIFIAMILFILGGLAGYISVLNDPLHIYSIIPIEMAKSVDPEALGTNNAAINPSLMSAEIMTNNIQVAILAFAGGITFGILTVYLLIYNGLIIGALASLFWHYGKSYEFWAFIAPHGMIELIAIFIAGGAGLLMGYKLFTPGIYSRTYQLKRQAKRSVQLFLGTIPLFIIAGIIEGYLTPTNLTLEIKYIIAIFTVLSLIAYIVIGMVIAHQTKSAITTPDS